MSLGNKTAGLVNKILFISLAVIIPAVIVYFDFRAPMAIEIKNIYGMFFFSICSAILSVCFLFDRGLINHDFNKKKEWLYFIVLYNLGVIIMLGLTYFPDIKMAACILPMIFTARYELRYGLLSAVIFGASYGFCVNTNIVVLIELILVFAAAAVCARFYNKVWHLIISGIVLIAISTAIVLGIDTAFYSVTNVQKTIMAVNPIALSVIIYIIFSIVYKPNKKGNQKKVIQRQNLFDLVSPACSAYAFLAKNKAAFSYGMRVSQFAQLGAKSIGEDDIVAKVSGLYYHIGENENTAFTVSQGIKAAKSHDLPEEVIEIISEQDTSKKLPSTKISAICLLANDVVSICQKEKISGSEQIKKVIELVFIKRIKSGCLNDSALTINEVDRVKQAFIDWSEIMR